jgi:plasmid maintenance system antidote protein VapI
MKSFSLSELNRHPGEIVDAALAAPVSLTKHGKAFRLEDAPEAIHNELMEALEEIVARP